MPAGDRRGPAGNGPMTGRRAGYCTGNNAPGYASPYGRGGGRGFGGGGRGWRNQFYATGQPGWARSGYYRGRGAGYGYAPPVPEITPIEEIDILNREAEYMKNELKALETRVQELKDVSTGNSNS